MRQCLMILLLCVFAGAIEPNSSVPLQPMVTAVATTVDAVSANIPQREPLLTIVTSRGKLICELYPSAAPKTVDNFLKLSKEGFYNGLKFHRVIPGFVAQGGDPLTRGVRDKDWTINPRLAYSAGMPLAGTGGPGYTIKAEFNNYRHETGTLAMARSQDPDSAGSQFYICLAPQPHLDGNYTVFGKVIEGMQYALALKPGDEIQSIALYPVLPQEQLITQNKVTENLQ